MLFDPFSYRSHPFRNRCVMAPMTRSRAIGNVPNALMAEYYAQRAGAGLIITEGTSPSPNGLGYARIPGLFDAAQVQGWRGVTDAVHARGGRMFVQLMHTGRVTHVENLPRGAQVLGPTDVTCPGEMWTDAHGMQPHNPPRAMTESDIAAAVSEYARSAELAIEAGFDGVELHAANGYLIEQFLNANVNTRTDGYGGSIAARNRFALEVARAVVGAIGADRVGIRLSPYGAFNHTGEYPDVEPQYLALVQELSALRLVFLHVLDHSAMGAPARRRPGRHGRLRPAVPRQSRPRRPPEERRGAERARLRDVLHARRQRLHRLPRAAGLSHRFGARWPRPRRRRRATA